MKQYTIGKVIIVRDYPLSNDLNPLGQSNNTSTKYVKYLEGLCSIKDIGVVYFDINRLAKVGWAKASKPETAKLVRNTKSEKASGLVWYDLFQRFLPAQMEELLLNFYETFELIREECHLAKIEMPLFVCEGGMSMLALIGEDKIAKTRGSLMYQDSLFEGCLEFKCRIFCMHSMNEGFSIIPSEILKRDLFKLRNVVKGLYEKLAPKPSFVLSISNNETLGHLKKLYEYDKEEILDVAYDLETSTYNILCISFAYVLEGVTEVYSLKVDTLDKHLLKECIQRIFNNPKIRFIAQNANFDMTKLHEEFGIQLVIEEDTLHLFRVLHPRLESNLNFISSFYNPYHVSWKSGLEFVSQWQEKGIHVSDDVARQALEYNAEDSFVTLKVFQTMMKLLTTEENQFIYRYLISSQMMLSKAGSNGLLVDLEMVEKYKSFLFEKIIATSDILSNILATNLHSFCTANGLSYEKELENYGKKKLRTPKPRKKKIEKGLSSFTKSLLEYFSPEDVLKTTKMSSNDRQILVRMRDEESGENSDEGDIFSMSIPKKTNAQIQRETQLSSILADSHNSLVDFNSPKKVVAFLQLCVSSEIESSDKKILKEFKENTNTLTPSQENILTLFLDFRATTYIYNWCKNIGEKLTEEGRLKSSLALTAKTFRVKSSERTFFKDKGAALQNISARGKNLTEVLDDNYTPETLEIEGVMIERPPRMNLRALFKASEGKVFVGMDLVAADAWVIAWELAEMGYFELYNDLMRKETHGEDFHKKNAAILFHTTPDKIGSNSWERDVTKNYFYAFLYDANVYTLRAQNPQWTINEVVASKKILDSKYHIPKLTKLREADIMAGRPIQNVYGMKFLIENRKEISTALNVVPQSTVAVITNMIALGMLKEHGHAISLATQVHDSLMFEVPEHLGEYYQKELKRHSRIELPYKRVKAYSSGDVFVSKRWEK